jgi:molybdate transport system substrate-binding protein
VKKTFLFAGLAMLLIAALTGCGGGEEQPKAKSEPVTLTISAAASLKDALEELKTVYAGQHPDMTVTYNFAASGPLQRQIEEGAPVDLFISAGKSQMDTLAGKGLIVDASRKDLLGNELVLIAKNESKLAGFEGLTDPAVAKIGIGTPETVPAGKYAQEALASQKLWDKLQPKLVQAKDVRQVLTYVETSNVDAGIVYRSDAMSGKDVKVVAAAPPGSHKPIEYPMAVIKSTKHQKETEVFAAFLSGEEAARVFQKYGFKPAQK